jgi:hypothetical protein
VRHTVGAWEGVPRTTDGGGGARRRKVLQGGKREGWGFKSIKEDEVKP